MLYPVELRAPGWNCAPRPAGGPQRSGRGRGIRTPDILLPKQARYQTALYPADVERFFSISPATRQTCRRAVIVGSAPHCVNAPPLGIGTELFVVYARDAATTAGTTGTTD